MRLISASSLQRISTCTASAVMPAVNTPSSSSASRGSAIHKYIQCNLDGVTALVPPEVADVCKRIDMEAIRALIDSREHFAELAHCYNVFSEESTLIGSDIGRNYPDAERGDVFGTSDLCASGDEASLVVDFKAGHWKVTPVKDNWQMRLGALSFANATGKRTIEMVIAYLSDDGSSWEFDAYTATGMDLDAWADELRDIYLKIEAAEKAYEEGKTLDVSPSEDNCRYCACITSCPAKTQLVKALATELKMPDFNELTPVVIGECWEKIQAWKKVLEHMEAGITDIATQSPVPLPNGKVLKVTETRREFVKGEVAYRILSEALGPEKARQVCKMTATKEAFKTLGADGDKALELVRSGGGVDVKVSSSVKEVKNGTR